MEEQEQQANLDKKKRELSTLIKNHEDQKQKIKDEKIKRIDDLRKEMLLEIRQVKIKMLNMNED
jgi:hypothetical protein